MFYLEGFPFICQSISKKRGGGVAFFVNKLIKHDIVQKLSTSINNLFECITVELCIEQKIYVSCVYRQPQINIADFTEYMDSMFHCLNGNLYMCGEFNIDLFKYDRESNTKYLSDNFFSCLYIH